MLERGKKYMDKTLIENQDLQIIQQNYGDKMCQLCAESFSNILNMPGILSQVLLNQYEPSFTLYDDLVRNNQINQFTLMILKKSIDAMNSTKINTMTYAEQVASRYSDPMIRADIMDGMDPFGDFSK